MPLADSRAPGSAEIEVVPQFAESFLVAIFKIGVL